LRISNQILHDEGTSFVHACYVISFPITDVINLSRSMDSQYFSAIFLPLSNTVQNIYSYTAL